MARHATAGPSSITGGSALPRHLLTLFLLTAGLLLAFTSTAFAVRAYDSQLTEANGTAFTNPFGVEVDNSDNLWVSDTGSMLVSKFDSTGGYLAQNDGTGSWAGSAYVQDLAYGNAASLVYAVDSNFDDLWGLNLDTTYASVDLNGLGGGCCYLRAAVDNTGGANDGDIYVASSGATVTRIDGTGAASNFSGSASYITGNQINGNPDHSFASLAGVTVDTNGNFYLVEPGTSQVHQYDSTGIFVRTFSGSFDTLSAVAVDPTNGNVLIGDSGQGVVHEFDSSGNFIDDTDGSGTPDGSMSPQGLAVDSTGALYVSDASHPVVNVFAGSGPPPVTHTLDVTKSGAGAGTVTSAPAGIDCGATCTDDFNENSTVTLTATPDADNTFTGWTVDGDTNVCPGTGTCEVSIGTADHAVIANFEPIPQHTLDVSKIGTGTVTSSPSGIACGADCTQDYIEGTVVTLTATPGANQHFVGWSGGGCSGTGTCQVTLDADVDVTATFAVNTHTLTVSKTGTGSGTVTGSVGSIDCGSTCSDDYGHGTVVTLTATPAAGSTFTGWSGGGCSGTGTCQVTVNANAAVTASFVPTDTDGDGVPDSTDQCDTQAGPASNNGCPVVTPPPAGKLTVPGTAKVKSGKAKLKLSCKGAANATACEGQFKLTVKVKVGKKKKTKVVATVNYGPIAAGDDATVTISLSKVAKRLLAKTGKLNAKIVRVDGSTITNDGRTVTLKGGKKKAKKKK